MQIADPRTADELERQLKKEINHLTFQCEKLAALLENGKRAIRTNSLEESRDFPTAKNVI